MAKNVNELEKVIMELSMYFDKNAKEKNSELIDSLFEMFKENEEMYETQISLAYLYFTSFAALPWLSENPQVTNGWEKMYIESIYNGQLPHFVRKIIEKNEGSACSGDKEHFVISKIKESVATGKNLSLYATYEGHERIPKEDWDKQAYWSPKSFKDTDEVKARFKAWYNVESCMDKQIEQDLGDDKEKD